MDVFEEGGFYLQEAVVVFSRKESKFGELRKSDLIRAPSKVDAAVARSSPFVRI